MNSLLHPSELNQLVEAHELLQSDLANAIGLSQGQVSRLLSGDFKKTGKTYERLCIYVSKIARQREQINPIENEEIMNAIASVWDGSPRQARYLAQIIRSLGPLCNKGAKC